MKVLLVSYAHDEGGIQTHTRFLARGLVSRGHTVCVVSPRPMRGHKRTTLIEESITLETYGGLASAVTVMRRCRPDVAVVTGTGWKAMAGVSLLPKRCKKVFFEVMSGVRGIRLDPRCLIHRGFDAVASQARPVQTRFVSDFNWLGPSVCIPAVPEPLELLCNIPSRRFEPIEQGSPLRFASFGRLVPHKGTDLLIKYWNQYAPKGSSLDIWGSGPEAGHLEKLIWSSDLSSAITLRGRYPAGKDYVELLQTYDLLLLPTIGEEGAPLVLLEAMACGLPFVANGVGGIADYENQDCCITDGDISKFVPAIEMMIARLRDGSIDPQRMQKHYKEYFGFDKLISRWECFLSELVHSE